MDALNLVVLAVYHSLVIMLLGHDKILMEIAGNILLHFKNGY